MHVCVCVLWRVAGGGGGVDNVYVQEISFYARDKSHLIMCAHVCVCASAPICVCVCIRVCVCLGVSVCCVRFDFSARHYPHSCRPSHIYGFITHSHTHTHAHEFTFYVQRVRACVCVYCVASSKCANAEHKTRCILLGELSYVYAAYAYVRVCLCVMYVCVGAMFVCVKFLYSKCLMNRYSREMTSSPGLVGLPLLDLS